MNFYNVNLFYFPYTLFDLANIKNVIIVHCLAGKGRTGTVICCYMIFSGRVTSADEALTYYKNMR